MPKNKPRPKLTPEQMEKATEQFKKIADLTSTIQASAQKALEPLQESISNAAKYLKGPQVEFPSLYEPMDFVYSPVSRRVIDIEDEDEYTSNTKFLTATPDGGFKYKGKYLKGLSTDSQEGQLLAKFLESEGLFLTGLEPGFSFYRNFSFVIRDLKNAFRKNGLEAIIERRKKNEGYIFMDIEKLKKRKIRVKT